MVPNNSSIVNSVFATLRYVFVVVPIVAGLDKFIDFLANWDAYLHPAIASMLPFPVHTFMIIVGVTEIVAGVIVLVNPRIGGFIVSAWLVLIALTLLARGMYLDVAVRDIVMAISAFSMARLSLVIATPIVQRGS